MSRFRDTDNLIGQSNNFVEVLEQVSRAAALDKPVLIIGERGTGKELIAARLHYLSTRWQQPYIQMNCAALNENLLESELFGHESGAFTGASKKHEGRFERAHTGTLFLDELANTSSLVQEKLLRVIEYGEFERVGGNKPVRVDVRLVAATNEDLPTLVANGKFRADLLDRLAFDVITLPPLRERQDDILLLAEHFAIQMARDLELECFPGFTKTCMQQLCEYPWPGNVRELKNVIERSLYRSPAITEPLATIIFDPFASPWRPLAQNHGNEATFNTSALGSETKPNEVSAASANNSANSAASASSIEAGAKLKNSSLPTPHNAAQFTLPDAGEAFDFKDVSQNFEIHLLNDALKQCQYNQKKTADLLGLSYHQLRGYLKKYQLLEGARDE